MSDLNQRIEAMYQGDKRGAWLVIAFLWITILFVLFMTWPYIPDAGIKTAVVLAAAGVLIFNTASISVLTSLKLERFAIVLWDAAPP